MDSGGHHVTRTQFEANLAAKRDDPNFIADIGPLLSSDYDWNFETMADKVSTNLITRLAD
jgi:hypothetical protein